MSEHIELKLRGRLGRGLEGELRILNRIVRVNASGLEYEADPRHVELITESLELAGCKPVSTPGVKNPDPSLEPSKNEDAATTQKSIAGGEENGPKAEEELCNIMDMYCALTSDNPNMTTSACKSVTFDESVNTMHKVTPYSQIYGFLPASRVPTCDGWRLVSARADHFTGKSHEIMATRRNQRAMAHEQGATNVFRNRKCNIGTRCDFDQCFHSQ